MHFIDWKKCLWKVEDPCYEFSINGVDIFRIIPPEVFYIIDVQKDFLKLTGKHLNWSHFFNTVTDLNVITKRLQHSCEISTSTYFVEHILRFENFSCRSPKNHLKETFDKTSSEMSWKDFFFHHVRTNLSWFIYLQYNNRSALDELSPENKVSFENAPKEPTWNVECIC